MAQPHREMKDHALRALFAQALGTSLGIVGVRSARLVRSLPAELLSVQTHAVAVDALLEDEKGTLWHLEFETGSSNPWRTIRHHVAVRDAYPGRPVCTVVFWTRRRSRRHALRAGELSLVVQEVLLARRRGETVLRRLTALAAGGRPLRPSHGLLLALVPLMHNDDAPSRVVERGLRLAPALPAQLRAPVLEALQALAYSRSDDEERRRIREVLREMPLPQELYRDLRREAREEGWREGREEGRQEGLREGRQEGLQLGRQEGREEGLLTGARRAVLDVLEARFGAVAAEVREVVEAAGDRDTLQRWLRAAVRAPSAEAARRAIAEPTPATAPPAPRRRRRSGP